MSFKYYFGWPGGATDATKAIVGGKGAGLIEMSAMGLPVPPGFVIPTTECVKYLSASEAERALLVEALAQRAVEVIEGPMAEVLGYAPLVSVRSGARVSMPGMMDTVLNVGLNKATRKYWVKRLGAKCVAECEARLQGFDPEAASVALRFQLESAIERVFTSWNSERAKEYRRLHNYPDGWGTAVVIQAMVFGNMNTRSCSGVLFTRDPATGENFVTGEFLPQAQGEDVVAGVRTPLPLHQMEQWNATTLTELLEISGRLEAHYKEVQDVEFTVEDGRLFVLQTRNAKRTALAAFVVAHDMANEGIITRAQAVARVTPQQYQALLTPRLAEGFTGAATFSGLPASPGLVSGVAVFNAEAVKSIKGPKVLIRHETSPDDFPMMVQSDAILTSTGGATSHAAVVARGLNKPAVVGAVGLNVVGETATVIGTDVVIREGTKVTIDGHTGAVWVGVEVPVTGGALPAQAETLVRWAAAEQNVLPFFRVLEGCELPTSGEYYLSVADLKTKKHFYGLLKALAERPKLHGVIGFSRANKPSDDEVAFLTMLGVDPVLHTPAEIITPFLRAFLVGALSQKMKRRWVVHLPGATDMQLESLTDAGWSVVRPVRVLKDLLAANGFVTFDAEFAARMAAERVDLGEMVGLLAVAGRTLKEFREPLLLEDLVVEALGK